MARKHNDEFKREAVRIALGSPKQNPAGYPLGQELALRSLIRLKQL